MKHILGLTLCAMTFCSWPTDTRAKSSGPTDVTIDEVTHAGAGCPGDSEDDPVTVELEDGRSQDQLVIRFPSMVAAASDGPVDRTVCRVTVLPDYSGSWRYRLRRVRYPYEAELDAGTAATFKSQYYFQGTLPTSTALLELDGPADVAATQDQGFTDKVWSACTPARALNLALSVRVDSSEGAWATARLDTPARLAVEWERCD